MRFMAAMHPRIACQMSGCGMRIVESHKILKILTDGWTLPQAAKTESKQTKGITPSLTEL
jgi:hypothetical protein